MLDTYICDYLLHITFRFYSINFQLDKDFPSRCCIFYRKITKRYSKIGISRKWFLKRAKTCRFFCCKNYRLKLFFYTNWKQFQILKIAKFEFGVTVHHGLWEKMPQVVICKDRNMWIKSKSKIKYPWGISLSSSMNLNSPTSVTKDLSCEWFRWFGKTMVSNLF